MLPRKPKGGSAEDYADVVQHLNRLTAFVTIALIALCALSILIIQRIGEDAARDAANNARLKHAALALDQAEFAERELRLRFEEEIRHPQSGKKKLRVKASEDDLHVFSTALNALQPKGGPDLDNPLINEARQRLRALAQKEDGYRDAEILFQTSVARAHAFVKERGEFEEQQRKLLEGAREKEAIPFPFGEIKVDPRVALICLALAAAAGYVFLVGASRNVIARISDRRVAQATVPPLWLYTADEQRRRNLGWTDRDERRRLTSALALHTFWILLSIALVFAILRYHAGKSVEFATDEIVLRVVAAFNAVAVAAFVVEFFPRGAYRRVASLVPVSKTRRALIVSLVGVAGATAAGVLLFRKKTPGHLTLTTSFDASIAKLSALGSTLVGNAKTKIVHHTRVCRGHLPTPAHTQPPVQEGAKLHPGREAVILYATVEDVEKRLAAANQMNRAQLETLAGLVEKAMGLAPLSYHLHDKLIRIYGRLARYNDVGRVIQAGIDAASKRLQRKSADAKPDKVAQKALEHFKALEARAQQNAKDHREKEEKSKARKRKKKAVKTGSTA